MRWTKNKPVLLFIWLALLAFMSELSAPMVRAEPDRLDCRAWMGVVSPRPRDGALSAVSAASSDVNWAVGLFGSSPAPPLLEHWDGQAWSLPVAQHLDGWLNGV